MEQESSEYQQAGMFTLVEGIAGSNGKNWLLNGQSTQGSQSITTWMEKCFCIMVYHNLTKPEVSFEAVEIKFLVPLHISDSVYVDDFT